jgi:RNA polymerase sigma factor (sigma-70 family)
VAEPTDDDLLARWRESDRAAGDALFARHFDTVYGFFARRVHGDVSDLVQRTFLGMTEARDRIRGDASVRTFLFVIARRELHAHYEAQARGRALDFGVSSLEDLAPSPSSLLRHRDERALLAEALRRIPVDLQIVLELHYWQDMAGPEIARVIEAPEGTVRSRLRRALESLRERLSELDATRRSEWADEALLESWTRSLRA